MLAGTLTEFKDIVHHYCRSRNFWFDVVCVIPLECLVLAIPDSSIHMKVFGFLRLNRVIKVLDVRIVVFNLNSTLTVLNTCPMYYVKCTFSINYDSSLFSFFLLKSFIYRFETSIKHQLHQ